MTSSLSLQTNRLSSQLKLYSKKKFTGRLDIEIGQTQQWSLYLSLGRLSWAAGGVHPVRRWYRQITRCCPQVNLQAIQLSPSELDECWDYKLLTLLAKRKIAKTEEVLAVVRGMMAEVLFDMMHSLELAWSPHQRNFKITPRLGSRPCASDGSGILPRTWTLEVERTLLLTHQAWEQWCRQDCRIYSPNTTLIIRNNQQLQAQLSSQAYQNIMAIANNQRTLRDVAIVKNLDVAKLMRSLFPYIKQDLIALQTLPDLPSPQWVNASDSTPTCQIPQPLQVSSPKKKPLVICIDDSAHSCSQMYHILSSADCDCLGIQDPLKVLPILMKCQPDMIFIDLIMPITNGYELCAQIRRISQFQEIPIILMTGSISVIDRVRGNMVQASDFLTKPMIADRVLAVVERFKLKEKTLKTA